MFPHGFKSFAILPAAGVSRRMGQHKLLLPWRGKSIIEHVLTSWQASRVDHVALVVRPGDERLAAIGHRLGVDIVVPPTDPAEMKESVRLGLAFVVEHYHPRPEDAWLVAPADLPRLTSQVIDRLVAAYRPGSWAAFVAVASGRRGHPLLLPFCRAAEVEVLPPGCGIKSIISAGDVVEVDVQVAAIHEDLDTPEDYRRLG
jgi:molybdenum cofactor cytidylyltransferase